MRAASPSLARSSVPLGNAKTLTTPATRNGVAITTANVFACAPPATRDALRNDVTKDGLSTKFRDGTANDIAKEMVRLAADGLKERGLGEEVYLKYLQTVVERGSSNAARMSELNASEWKDDLSKVYEYATFPDVLPTF